MDGLRALAVAAVLTYHLGAGWLPGGFLGVDVFFVISGFLITSLLLVEFRAKGRINLLRFWMRRALRLLPAVFVMIAVVLVAMLVLHPGEVSRVHGPVAASLGYVANWYFAFAEVPYFEQFGRPSIFQHMWSLAVEEQFYLIWPPILAAGLAVVRLRGLIAGVAVVVAASTVLAWVLWEPFTDPSRIYYGTDTRAVGLLAGVLLALLWPLARRATALRRTPRVLMEALGILSLALLALAMLRMGELDERLYRGGFLAVGVVTAGLIAAVAHPATSIGRAFGTPLLVWVGLRSYGIYLWHWPVIMLTRPNVDIALDGASLVILRLVLIVGAAALSYRFVERPIRVLGIPGLRERFAAFGRRFGRPAQVASAASVAVACVALGIAVAVVPAETTSVPGIDVAAAAEAPLDAASESEPAPTSADVADTASESKRPTRRPRILFVGDSVMLGASRELRRSFGRRAVVDARVGRQFPEGAATIKARLRKLPKNAIVVVHLGSNGFVQFKHLEKLMRDLKTRPRVVLVTVRVAKQWEASVNDALRFSAERYRNTVIADWNRASEGSGILVDGAHMSPKGMRVYSRTIAQRLS